jgi:hypothetical protein
VVSMPVSTIEDPPCDYAYALKISHVGKPAAEKAGQR